MTGAAILWALCEAAWLDVLSRHKAGCRQWLARAAVYTVGVPIYLHRPELLDGFTSALERFVRPRA